jgi:TnpA family transposase
MRAFQSAYLGRHEFPSHLGEFELRQWFTFDVRDRRTIRRAFRSRYWIGAALQVGFLAMTGTTLASLEYVPAILLRHLGRQFVQKAPDLATLRSLYRRSQTLYEHQRWAIEHRGLTLFDEGAEKRLAEHLAQQTHGTMSRSRLEQMSREWLYRSYVQMPRQRVITDIVRGVLHAVVRYDHEVLQKQWTDATVQICLQQLLEHRAGHAMTHLEWLRRPPRRRSLKTLHELMEKYQWLRRLVGHRARLPIPKERQQVYARRIRRRRASHIPRLPPFQQELEASCFAAVTLGTLADDILRLIEMRIVAIWTWGYKIAAERVTPNRVRQRGQILAELRRLVSDPSLSDTAFRAQVGAMLLPEHTSAPISRAADVREVLTRNARRIRPLLELLVTLDIRGAGPGFEGLAWLKDTYEDGLDSFCIYRAPPWARRWESLVESSDSGRALRAFEAVTVAAVRQGLRNGSLYSPYGNEFCDPEQHLMPPAVWSARRAAYKFEKALPYHPTQYTDRAQAALRASLAALQEAVAAGDVWIGRKDLYFRRDEAQEKPEGVELAQASLYRAIGRVQLPTLLLELDARVHFSWKLLGREPKHAEELLGVYGALLAAGTDLQSRGVAGMIRGVHESTVRRYMRLFEAEPAMRAANDALLQFTRSHSIVNHWGTGYEASSDLMSLDASKHLYDARVDPKRRVHGMGVYQTILDQWGILYDQPLPLLHRQVGAAIEGVVRQRSTPIRWLAVDTHGHTHLGLGIAKLLGFDLCSRQYDMRHQWLHLPRGWPPVPSLEPVLRRDLDLDLIHAELDELLRVAASINDGYGSATFLLERLGSAARGSRLHQAGTQFGQLWGAVYLCDYAAQLPFRRGINRVLVRGESVHQLERVIHTGPIRSDRGRRRDEKVLISGALTLLTNAVIAYNTWKLHKVIERRRAAGRPLPSDETLSHIAPIGFRHINFHGVYRFPLERYLDRLLPSTPIQPVVVGG